VFHARRAGHGSCSLTSERRVHRCITDLAASSF
jgi:hypothetical protein